MLMRIPEKGQVKSRLAADLGEEIALELYEAFIGDLIATFGSPISNPDRPLTLFFHPPASEPAMWCWREQGYECRPQAGSDLGERMMDAMKTALASFDRVLLIGSDSPDLSQEVIDSAFSCLDGSDVVLGPSLDGGYYLIGFRADTLLPDAFANIDWGTDRVLQQTLERFESARYRVSLAPPWQDIDRVQDLRDFFHRHQCPSTGGSQTMACIQRHRKEILGEAQGE